MSFDTTRVPTPGTTTDRDEGIATEKNGRNGHIGEDGNGNKRSLDLAEKPGAAAADSGAPAEDYPTGTKLVFIIIAVVLSTFLIAMDMVCLVETLGLLLSNTANTSDYHCHGDTQDHR